MNVLSIDVDWGISNLHQSLLTRFFYNKTKVVDEIIFANYHHSILEVLPTNIDINLYNVDHHHDVCYQEWQCNKIRNYGTVEYGCWVGGLLYKNRLASVTWIGNVESEPVRSNTFAERFILDSKSTFTVDFSLERLYNKNYDMIFVCRSDDYISSEYRGLYDTYLNSCLELYPSKTRIVGLKQENIPFSSIII